ncbi:hypothetical protein TNCV_1162961 [Trichonephila clavipes]|nr:hypothetical protein TNCV_1162961 [Trichonephila clavipes]
MSDIEFHEGMLFDVEDITNAFVIIDDLMNEERKTTQLGKERNNSTRQHERNNSTSVGENNSTRPVGTKQLNSSLRNETTELCTAVDRLQPPTTACNRLRPPTTACNRLQPPTIAYNRLQPPATACTACTAFTAESAFIPTVGYLKIKFTWATKNVRKIQQI